MQHDFFNHMTPLVLVSASCNANAIVISTVVFIRSWWLKQCVIQLFWSCTAIWTWKTCSPWHTRGRNGGTLLQQFPFSPPMIQQGLWDMMMMTAMMLLSVLHDANSIINGTIPFVRSRWSKGDATWLSGYVMPLASSIAPLHFFSQDNQNEVQHNSFGHVMLLINVSRSDHTNTAINGTIPLVRSRWSKEDEHDFFIMWCHLHQHQYHMMPMASSMPQLHLLSKDTQNELQHWHWFRQHMMPMAPKWQ